MKSAAIEKIVEDTIKKFKLFNKKTKVAVAVSGGKDSTVLLYILKKLGYNVRAITVDAVIGNYTKENLKNIKQVCKDLNVKLDVISFKDEFGYSLCYIRSLLNSKGVKLNSCTICGVLRRQIINKYAKKMKFERVTTGHNLDDEAQTTMMNLFRDDIDRMMRQGPWVGVIDIKNFVPRVKPLYFISEDDIKKYSQEKNFPVVYDKCPCSVDAYRNSFKEFQAELKKMSKKLDKNIVDFALEKINENKKDYKASEIQICEICGEPCNSKVCKACQIINTLKGVKNGSLSR
jgi:tRNA-5-methyluridine54 2-sulfurtransferase